MSTFKRARDLEPKRRLLRRSRISVRGEVDVKRIFPFKEFIRGWMATVASDGRKDEAMDFVRSTPLSECTKSSVKNRKALCHVYHINFRRFNVFHCPVSEIFVAGVSGYGYCRRYIPHNLVTLGTKL